MKKIMFIIVALSITLLSGRAAAIPPLFTVSPTPSYISVLEGQSGVFDFTVKNVGIEDITIFDVRLIDNEVANSIEYIKGDKNDAVFNTQIVNATNCAGKVLSTNGTCVFQQLFQTQDLDPIASGTNVGHWWIKNVVESSSPFDINFGRALVEVKDHGAVSTIPEPDTLFLLALGLFVIRLFTGPRSFCNQIAQAELT